MGYGSIRVQGKARLAHRLAYELLIGPIPHGLVIDHLCMNKACCNPYHMEPVTIGENSRRAPISGRAAINAAKTHCDYGHPLSGPNLMGGIRPRRSCKHCASRRRNAHRQKLRAMVAA